MSALAFFREFVAHPDRIGSVIPSSRYLTGQVVDTANIGENDVIIELGAGTGPVTSVLLRRFPHHKLLAFEPTQRLAQILHDRFPSLDIEQNFADAHLSQILEAHGLDHADRVISGLPWTMWSREQQCEVLDGITDALGPEGRFLTYTYVSSQMRSAGARFREVLGEYFEHVWTSPVQWVNIPPAVVLVADRPRCKQAQAS